jgi:hypothetical protein
VVVLRNTTRVASLVIIAGATLVAALLAAFIGRAVVQFPVHVEMRTILRASVIAAFFVVMAFVMISYLVRKSKLKNTHRR